MTEKNEPNPEPFLILKDLPKTDQSAVKTKEIAKLIENAQPTDIGPLKGIEIRRGHGEIKLMISHDLLRFLKGNDEDILPPREDNKMFNRATSRFVTGLRCTVLKGEEKTYVIRKDADGQELYFNGWLHGIDGLAQAGAHINLTDKALPEIGAGWEEKTIRIGEAICQTRSDGTPEVIFQIYRKEKSSSVKKNHRSETILENAAMTLAVSVGLSIAVCLPLISYALLRGH